MKTKQIYDLLLCKIIKAPAATKQWGKTFEHISTEIIWKTITSPLIPPSVFNTDFKIRHRIMYTSIILHQINKNRWSRDCAACESHPETVQHIFLECPSSKAFRDQLWQLITNKCNLQVVGETKGPNTTLVFTTLHTSTQKCKLYLDQFSIFSSQTCFIYLQMRFII